MNTNLIFLITVSFIFLPNIFAYGETYNLTIDDKNFEIFYTSDGNVIAMAIDNELTSLLVGLENVENDSLFNIEFSNELIRAENNDFAVLVKINNSNACIY